MTVAETYLVPLTASEMAYVYAAVRATYGPLTEPEQSVVDKLSVNRTVSPKVSLAPVGAAGDRDILRYMEQERMEWLEEPA